MKEKKIFYGVILLFIIMTIANVLSGLASLLTVKLHLGIFIFPVIMAVYYLLVFYIVFVRMKEFPTIKWWFFILILLLFFIPKDFFCSYSIEEVQEIENLKVNLINNVTQALFTASFACMSYFRYVKLDRSIE